MKVYSIKGLAHVEGDSDCAIGWLFLVESSGDDVIDGVESSSGRMFMFESVLGCNVWNLVSDVRQYGFLECFGNGR